MQNLIEANTPEEQATAINSILNKTNEAIASVLVSRDLLLEKANQLRNHELIGADTTYLGHVKFSDDVEVDPDNNQMKIKRTIIQSEVLNHDSDTNSHSDVREKLEEIPKTVSAPLMTGPGTVKTGANAQFEFSAQALLPNAYIQRINVHMPDGTIVARSGANVVNGVANFTLVFTGEDLSVKNFRVQAFDNFGSPSEFVTYSVTISTNNSPELGALICQNLPAVVEPGQTVPFTITGGVDPDGDALTYSIIKPDGAPLSFSKSNGLVEGEIVNVTLGAGATRNTVMSFTIKADDNRFGGTATKVFSFHVNTPPSMNAVVINGMPTLIKPDVAHTCNLTGAIDIDNGQVITYAISCADPAVTFSKTSGIAEGESFTINIGAAVNRAVNCQFTITASDALGSAQVVRQYPVNDLPVVDAVVCTGNEDPVEGGVVTEIFFTGATDENGQVLTYEIQSGYEGLTFSKTTNIAEGEVITVVAAKVSEPTTRTFSVKARDSFGELSTTSKELSLDVVVVLKTAAPTFIYPGEGELVPAVLEGEFYTFTLTEYDTYIDLVN